MASMGLSSRAVQGQFYRRLEETLSNSWYSRVIFNNTSDQQHEEYRFLDAVPAVREWTGQHAPSKLSSKFIRITNRKFETSVNIPSDDFRRDKTGQIVARINEMAQRFPLFIEQTITNYLISGTSSTTYGAAYDGQAFFSASHSEGASGTLKNLLTSSEVPSLNVGTANAPTEAEMSQALLNTIMYMYNYKDDKGMPINGTAREFVVVVPLNLAGAALGGVFNATFAQGVSNPLAALNARGWRIDVQPSQLLTTDTEFYVLRADGNTKPLIVQQEVGVMFDSLVSGSEYEIQNKQHLYTATWDGGFGYGQWQHAVKATLV